MEQSRIRNFCIIAHIDHGKSTLADRLLEITGTVEKRKLKTQMLDTMELEQERGITIKLQPARMSYRAVDGQEYQLNLIDTPGHVDFTYEVSRSLAAVEGAILLVDATQGVQAQTIANLYLAIDQGLEIIPVLNKIDLPNADIPRRAEELKHLIGCKREDILAVSGKTGEGVSEVLGAVVKRISPPQGHAADAPRALIFDSKYDDYRGVIAYVRMVDGRFSKNDAIRFIATHEYGHALEVGYLNPAYQETPALSTGEIGYIVTGLKEIAGVRVGDTVALKAKQEATNPLPGYKVVKPMVYAGIFPKEGDEYNRLRDAMEKVALNDAALTYEPEQSTALGFGFRCGLLGMLHLEILQERLKREHGQEIIVTTPSVAYEVVMRSGEKKTITSPLDFPDPSFINETLEPWVKADIVTPANYFGNVMSLVTERRGIFLTTEYLEESRAILHYEMPLSSVIVDFYDRLKSATQGYASLNYEFLEYRPATIVRLDILVAEDAVPSLATLIHKDEAQSRGRDVVETLKETLPRQNFVIKLQAAIGGTIVASERISAYRKDVTGYLYGGDVTRKMKLLEKQKKGKAKMMAMGKGKVDIPADAFIKVLRRRS
ncbi:translation elongation factor 4 [Patescibacteria group bacterium]|uniref:Elongation factor 4 n=1 Tax=candidate division WWE3 bacterium TaxID=2053526 RepID=A0A928Y548_UNCKA|nr:elongation factor 4 [candidate division WWE3 bacterium]MCL4732423.1 translation elongation factor 4 [Patescibacteria group bacterium]MDL1952670.1 elongation factor 4 [Candidatus Uhrbacteria bacterium UHB]RIL01198.1 MAG: elongation factor 4 [Candidatus Uhrbacteria bacterium]